MAHQRPLRRCAHHFCRRSSLMTSFSNSWSASSFFSRVYSASPRKPMSCSSEKRFFTSNLLRLGSKSACYSKPGASPVQSPHPAKCARAQNTRPGPKSVAREATRIIHKEGPQSSGIRQLDTITTIDRNNLSRGVSSFTRSQPDSRMGDLFRFAPAF